MQNGIKLLRLISLLDKTANLQETKNKVDSYAKLQSNIIVVVIDNESQVVLHITKPAIDFSGIHSLISKFS